MKTLILLVTILSLTACSSVRVMKNCRELAQGFFECEDP